MNAFGEGNFIKDNHEAAWIIFVFGVVLMFFSFGIKFSSTCFTLHLGLYFLTSFEQLSGRTSELYLKLLYFCYILMTLYIFRVDMFPIKFSEMKTFLTYWCIIQTLNNCISSKRLILLGKASSLLNQPWIGCIIMWCILFVKLLKTSGIVILC